jgi:hypothetical protein
MDATLKHMFTPMQKEAVIQRQCACGRSAGSDGTCAECALKRTAMQRSASGTGSFASNGVAQAVGIARRSGVPLGDGIRTTMERRVGQAARHVSIAPVSSESQSAIDAPGSSHEQAAEAVASHDQSAKPGAMPIDFRHVRVHADRAADDSARAVDADAFTVGRHIAFRSGQFNPHSMAGQKLLAHELTHVVQQSGGASRIQRQKVGEQRVRYDERVDSFSHKTDEPMSVWKGSVTRTERLEEYQKTAAKDKTPAKEGWEEVDSREGKANLEFDPTACKVRIPLRLNFRNPSFGPKERWDPCSLNNPTPTKALANDKFTKMRADFVSELNSGLNGWYTAKIEKCDKAPCAGKSISIVVDVHDGGGAIDERDQTVNLINADGRSCADHTGAYIYAPDGDADKRMWVHEAGHFVLGYGDEYAEKGRAAARVTHDYSAMGDAEKTRFAMFHARHFKFVPVFLSTVLHEMGHTGCQPSLQEMSRPSPTSFNLMFGEGYLWGNRGSGLYLDAGIEFGRSDENARRVEKIVGLHAKYLLDAGPDGTSAFLVGVRLGLERRWGGSGHGIALGGFVEGGGGAFGIGSKGGATAGAFGEVGAYFGYKAPLGSGYPSLRLEGAAGSQIGVSGQIGDPAPGATSMDQSNYWVRLGLNAVWTL